LACVTAAAAQMRQAINEELCCGNYTESPTTSSPTPPSTTAECCCGTQMKDPDDLSVNPECCPVGDQMDCNALSWDTGSCLWDGSNPSCKISTPTQSPTPECCCGTEMNDPDDLSVNPECCPFLEQMDCNSVSWDKGRCLWDGSNPSCKISTPTPPPTPECCCGTQMNDPDDLSVNPKCCPFLEQMDCNAQSWDKGRCLWDGSNPSCSQRVKVAFTLKYPTRLSSSEISSQKEKILSEVEKDAKTISSDFKPDISLTFVEKTGRRLLDGVSYSVSIYYSGISNDEAKLLALNGVTTLTENIGEVTGAEVTNVEEPRIISESTPSPDLPSPTSWLISNAFSRTWIPEQLLIPFIFVLF